MCTRNAVFFCQNAMRFHLATALLSMRAPPTAQFFATPTFPRVPRFVTFCETDADCTLPETCCGNAFRICCDAGGTGQRLPRHGRNVTAPWPVPRPVPQPVPIPIPVPL